MEPVKSYYDHSAKLTKQLNDSQWYHCLHRSVPCAGLVRDDASSCGRRQLAQRLTAAQCLEGERLWSTQPWVGCRCHTLQGSGIYAEGGGSGRTQRASGGGQFGRSSIFQTQQGRCSRQTQAQHGDWVGTKALCSQMTAAGWRKVRFLLWSDTGYISILRSSWSTQMDCTFLVTCCWCLCCCWCCCCNCCCCYWCCCCCYCCCCFCWCCYCYCCCWCCCCCCIFLLVWLLLVVVDFYLIRKKGHKVGGEGNREEMGGAGGR